MDTFRSVNPAHPDDVVGEYPTHGPADVDAAVARAAAAQRELGARSPRRPGRTSWPPPRR